MTPFDAPIQTESSASGVEIEAARPPSMLDQFGRAISYLRVSVTDRCDLRCVYCMSERMSFLPRAELLSIEELDRLCSTFIDMGTRKLRLTGGEPLVRKGLLNLIERLGRHLGAGALDELTMTTNGTRLGEYAQRLADLGVRRVNVSLDTLDPDTFRRVTRGGELSQVLAGLEAAKRAGLQVKINAVALRQDNLAELPQLMVWAHAQGFDLTLIETMPLGEVEGDRSDQYVSLSELRDAFAAVWTLTQEAHSTGGPARYERVRETGGRIGFITPLSHNFCESCNRVRVTCTGTLHTCLGQDDATDLRRVLRTTRDDNALRAAIRGALATKPKGHDFHIAPGSAPSLARHMSTTGG